MKSRYILLVAAILGLLAAVIVAPGIHLASDPVERITNGNFEAGFYATPAGLVPNGWQWFHNGGQAAYGFYDETWTPVVYEGSHSVMIEINTLGLPQADADRYAGVYQTVAVEPGETYDLILHGMLRALESDPDLDGYNYRLQYGVDHDGGTDWLAVDEWVEVPWDTVHPRLSPGEMDSYQTALTATGPRLTLFLRAWKKWATTGRELDLNLDAVSLRGAMTAGTGAGSAPSVGQGDGDSVSSTSAGVTFTLTRAGGNEPAVAGIPVRLRVQATSQAGISRLEIKLDGESVDSIEVNAAVPTLQREVVWTPTAAGTYTWSALADAADGAIGTTDPWPIEVWEASEFVDNGSFEEGFLPIARGIVGAGWNWFTSDGPAEFGFYDETWAPLVYDGEHSQLLEISTYGLADTLPDRYSGIYQHLEGLTPGATYRLSLHGMVRMVDDEANANGYRLQWGYATDPGGTWADVDTWTDVPWDEVYPRLAPGAMLDYETTFQAPASRLTLFFRAWKKWATVDRELDLNLDAISVTGYRNTQ